MLELTITSMKFMEDLLMKIREDIIIFINIIVLLNSHIQHGHHHNYQVHFGINERRFNSRKI